jgi:hypothetical protein
MTLFDKFQTILTLTGIFLNKKHSVKVASNADFCKKCVVLFVRAPQMGMVKTRLAKKVGAEIALDLHQKFTEDLINTLTSVGSTVSIYYHPSESRSQLIHWLGPSFGYYPQSGNDLGRRMEHAFCRSFEMGFNRVLLVGSDLPDLPVSFFHDAFTRLKTDDAVIGPSTDGGYYLIGFRDRTFFPEIFLNISWGSPLVLEQTLDRFREHRDSVHLLPPWRDIDDFEDLMAFKKKHRLPPYRTKTAKYLHRKELKLQTTK